MFSGFYMVITATVVYICSYPGVTIPDICYKNPSLYAACQFKTVTWNRLVYSLNAEVNGERMYLFYELHAGCGLH